MAVGVDMLRAIPMNSKGADMIRVRGIHMRNKAEIHTSSNLPRLRVAMGEGSNKAATTTATTKRLVKAEQDTVSLAATWNGQRD